MNYSLVIFDMDGTLTEELLDFPAIRRDIGLPDDGGILEHLEHMTPADRARAEKILDHHELTAADNCLLHDGAHDILETLRTRGIKTALLTRNSSRCADRILTRHGLQLHHVSTREDRPHKPHAESILSITRKLAVNPQQTLMVGDYLYDLQAAANAGTDSALFCPAPKELPPFATMATYRIRSLRDLADIVFQPPQPNRSNQP